MSKRCVFTGLGHHWCNDFDNGTMVSIFGRFIHYTQESECMLNEMSETGKELNEVSGMLDYSVLDIN